MYDVAEYALDRNIRPELRSMELGDGIDTSQNALFPSFPHSNPTRARSPTPLRPPAHGVVCRHPIRALRALVHQHAEERIGSYSLPIRNAERRDSGHRHHRRIVDAAVTLHRKFRRTGTYFCTRRSPRRQKVHSAAVGTALARTTDARQRDGRPVVACLFLSPFQNNFLREVVTTKSFR